MDKNTATGPVPTKRIDMKEVTVSDDMLREAQEAAKAAQEEALRKADAQKAPAPSAAPPAEPVQEAAPLAQPGREYALDLASDHMVEAIRAQGDPTLYFSRVATIWSVTLGAKISPLQVSAMLAGLQLAELAEHADNSFALVKMIGAAAYGVEVSPVGEDQRD